MLLTCPRFPAPDDIGRELAIGLRRQVLLAAKQEAEDTALSLPPGPLQEEQTVAAVYLQELREQETGSA